MSSTFAERSITYHQQLTPNISLPNSVEWIDAFGNDATLQTFSTFMHKYYADNDKRYLLFGINPGRFGAGVTGVAFTDPIILENRLSIVNNFDKKHELSALFIHDVIDKFGGADEFYSQFFITSLNPVGLIKDGKNYNYYDDKQTLQTVEPFIIESIENHINLGCFTSIAFCIGQGTNFKYFSKLNNDYNWFDEIVPLPHPRWVMQYRRKTMQTYIDEYLEKLSNAL